MTRATLAILLIVFGWCAPTALAESQAATDRDLNGDGLADPIVANPNWDPRFYPLNAWTIFGKRDVAPIDAGNLGAAGVRLPEDCASPVIVGDVDADGTGELAIACPRPGRTRPEVVVTPLTGTTGSLDPFDPARHSLRITGASLVEVAPAGDVNGDRRADVVVIGARPRERRRRAWVVFGRALPASVDVRNLGGGGITIWGPPHASAAFTQWLTVHAAGDVNGDGRGDLAVGDQFFPDRTCRAPDLDCDGRAWIVFGRRRPPRLIKLPHIRPFGYTIRPTAEAEVEDIGAYVTSAGDLDGDGRDETIVGARSFAPNAIVPFVVWGTREKRRRDLVLRERNSYLWAWADATPMGDVNGDGRDDLAVVPWERHGGLNVLLGHRWRGGLHVQRLRRGRVATVVRQANAGLQTLTAGDVNGDRIPDFLVIRFTPIREVFVLFGARPLRPLNLNALGASGFQVIVPQPPPF